MLKAAFVSFAALVAAAPALAQAPAPAPTQTTILFPDDRPPTDDELRDILFGDGAPTTRGIQMKQPAAPNAPSAPSAAPSVGGAPSAPPAAPPPPRRSVAFKIQFAFDSAAVPKAALPQLAALAAAALSPEAGDKVIAIVGHTDTKGAADYNAELSYRRALAVRTLLVDRYGVPSARLKPQGRGEEQPLVGVAGEAAENRRVEFSVGG
jgi:outer membrane protein OmpA-like peptidoglycan-associated protein